MYHVNIDQTITTLGAEKVLFFLTSTTDDGVEVYPLNSGMDLIIDGLKPVPYSKHKEITYANEGRVHWKKEDFFIVCQSLIDLPDNYDKYYLPF
jgi:hypothetical protein